MLWDWVAQKPMLCDFDLVLFPDVPTIGNQEGQECSRDLNEIALIQNGSTEKPKLCDSSLSNLCDKPDVGVEQVCPCSPTSLSYPGIWIFMAAELLDDDAIDGEVKRVYRHEVGAFIAVLVWIICRYHDGKARDGNALGHWIQRSYLECKEKRRLTFDQITRGTFPQPAGLPNDIWIPLCMALASMRKHSQDGIEAQKGEAEYMTFVAFDPNFAFDGKSPKDYKTLQALPKILTWPVFRDSARREYYGPIETRVSRSTGA
jgi:hypothetical protein